MASRLSLAFRGTRPIASPVKPLGKDYSEKKSPSARISVSNVTSTSRHHHTSWLHHQHGGRCAKGGAGTWYMTQTAERAQANGGIQDGRVMLKPQAVVGTRQYDMVKSIQDGKQKAARILDHQNEASAGKKSHPYLKQLYVEETIESDKRWHVTMTVDREYYRPVIRIQERKESGQASDNQGARAQEKASIKRLVTNSRFSFDDAAHKRQPDLFALRDTNQEVKQEVDAEKHGLVYVRMDGNIGNVVNGAGLAMATNDAISLYGGTSANFLDAGGQATKETMLQASGMILRDERVKKILVNIYGGITRCDMIAESIIAAASELGPLRVPIVANL
ncbi:hypothetical protein F66182_9971 [Fusarium sp. NRRL 66182]|nr:hypothetical protein F66182_9971 [Fusarium sp. NRRL 66182]